MFINLTNNTPQAVAMTNENAPIAKIPTDFAERNDVACVEQPTVKPIKIVHISTIGPEAAFAKRFVTPDSFNKLPKHNIPRSGSPEGTMKQHKMNAMIGKIHFSVLVTWRGGFILINLSFLVVNALMIGG